MTRKQERLLVNLAIETSRTDHPNPERRGCPGGEALQALADRRIKGERLGELVDHIADCSPCFLEYERLTASIRNRRAAKLTMLVAIGLGMALLIRNYVPGRQMQSPSVESAQSPPPVSTRLPTPVALVVDLRFSAPARGQGPSPANAPPTRFPRAVLNIRIQLPLGSAEGQYEVAIFRDGAPQLPSATGSAEFRNQMEELDVSMDTRSISPGPGELRLRHAGSTWQRFPILIE